MEPYIENIGKKIIIIGAGPAGLTAAYELQKAGECEITIIEADTQVGGISRTVNYNGNRIDIGGHRFFSKSDWVMNWWTQILPLSKNDFNLSLNLKYHGQVRSHFPLNAKISNSESEMLVCRRLSRIYYNRNFFDYPLKIKTSTLKKLGLKKTLEFGLSYLWSHIKPIRSEISLEDFLINRFGEKLYLMFFKEYTEKVWGVPCSAISSEWGAQRIRSLSVGKALWHGLKSALGIINTNTQHTSLAEHFIYPKYGPGQMWETVAKKFIARGGKILFQSKVDKIDIENDRVVKIHFSDDTGHSIQLPCTHVISTMPIKDLILASKTQWSDFIIKTATGLAYRNFITVGLLYRNTDFPRKLEDNWLYIQEPGVRVGRVQIFNNWSPYLVANKETVWLGLEFFVNETDPLWTMSDESLKQLAQREIRDIGLISASSFLDAAVLRMPKAYPGYFGESYQNFAHIRSSLDEIHNLFLVGRNGMHRYNNQDHSMLTAREASTQIISGVVDKSKIWAINVNDDYHEESKYAYKI